MENDTGLIMTREQQKENNQKIAEFMGLNLAANGAKCEDPRHNDGTISPIRFHESWDWIMPVIDKIERWGYPIVIRLNVVEIYSLTKMLGG